MKSIVELRHEAYLNDCQMRTYLDIIVVNNPFIGEDLALEIFKL